MSHTKGPWEYSTEYSGTREIATIYSEPIFYINSKNGTVVYGEQLEANAHLIAAAPDLLEALCDLVRYAEAVRFTAGMGKGQLEKFERAKSLISKARGETP